MDPASCDLNEDAPMEDDALNSEHSNLHGSLVCHKIQEDTIVQVQGNVRTDVADS